LADQREIIFLIEKLAKIDKRTKAAEAIEAKIKYIKLCETMYLENALLLLTESIK
jgi:rubrerythrin